MVAEESAGRARKIDSRAVGQRIRAARLSKGWSQQHFAALVGVSKTSACNYERGAVLPSLTKMLAVALVLDRSLDWIVRGVRRTRATRLD